MDDPRLGIIEQTDRSIYDVAISLGKKLRKPQADIHEELDQLLALTTLRDVLVQQMFSVTKKANKA